MEDELTEPVTICTVNDIKDNEMKTFELNENTKVLLVKQNGQLKAIGNKCSHYGAPLENGVLGQGRVRCPWHGACFSLETGDIEDFPGLDSLPCYDVKVDKDGNVKVQGKRQDLASCKRIKEMAVQDPNEDCTFVVIGGGPAGGVCAETLRQEGFTGRLIMLCGEFYLPYDRVKISKAMDIPIENIQFRTKEWYDQNGIEVHLGVRADSVNVNEKTIQCSNNKEIKYTKVFVATGSRPYAPSLPGDDLRNVVTLRGYDDAVNIVKKIKSSMNVVCLGASFISLESAAYLQGKVKSVTVIGRDAFPLKSSFGLKIGRRMLQLFEEKGVTMIMKNGISEIIGANGQVKELLLMDGSKVPCDLLIFGTGSRLNTDFLVNSGVNINDNGSITANLQLQSNIPDIFVGGDIAHAPIYSCGNQEATIGHYQLAQYHGKVAAHNMVGKVKKLEAVPFFFTQMFGKGLRFSGYGKYKEVIIDGDLDAMKFAAYYINESDTVVAVASCGRDPIVSQFAELQSQGKCITRAHVEAADPNAWIAMLQN